MTFALKCDRLYPVSERKTMNQFKKNQMTLKEIERFMDAKRKREAKARAEIGLQNKVKELQNKG